MSKWGIVQRLAALIAIAVAGCTTTMVGSKLGPKPEGHMNGIPVNMTKPQFDMTLTPARDPDDDPDVGLTLKWVADYDHRYVLNLAPRELAWPGLDIAPGPQGQLIS